MDPITIYRLGQIRQQEILEQAQRKGGEVKLNPVALAFAEWLRDLLVIVNQFGRQELRGLGAEAQAYQVIEACTEPDQADYMSESTVACSDPC